MKFCLLIDYYKRNNFLQKSCTKWCRDTGSRPTFCLFFLKKALYKIKACCLQLIFSIFQWFSTWHAKQTLKNFILLIKRYAQFWHFRKGCGSNFSPTFCVWFFNLSTKTKFHCLISFPAQDIGKYVYLKCFPDCKVANFEIILVFLMK